MFKRLTVLIGIAVLALALAACAGGDDYGGDEALLPTLTVYPVQLRRRRQRRPHPEQRWFWRNR